MPEYVRQAGSLRIVTARGDGWSCDVIIGCHESPGPAGADRAAQHMPATIAALRDLYRRVGARDASVDASVSARGGHEIEASPSNDGKGGRDKGSGFGGNLSFNSSDGGSGGNSSDGERSDGSSGGSGGVHWRSGDGGADNDGSSDHPTNRDAGLTLATAATSSDSDSVAALRRRRGDGAVAQRLRRSSVLPVSRRRPHQARPARWQPCGS